jgi:hypothetical protein
LREREFHMQSSRVSHVELERERERELKREKVGELKRREREIERLHKLNKHFRVRKFESMRSLEREMTHRTHENNNEHLQKSSTSILRRGRSPPAGETTGAGWLSPCALCKLGVLGVL